MNGPVPEWVPAAYQWLFMVDWDAATVKRTAKRLLLYVAVSVAICLGLAALAGAV